MHGTTELIASLDLGTTSARAIIFNAEGRPLAASQKPLLCSRVSTGQVFICLNKSSTF